MPNCDPDSGNVNVEPSLDFLNFLILLHCIMYHTDKCKCFAWVDIKIPTHSVECIYLSLLIVLVFFNLSLHFLLLQRQLPVSFVFPTYTWRYQDFLKAKSNRTICKSVSYLKVVEVLCDDTSKLLFMVFSLSCIAFFSP